MLDVEITLSDWVFDAIENNHVLTLSRRYFFLRKPLERRLYELARKHCGHQSEWRIGLETLREKCGSGSTMKEFRRLVGKIIEDDRQHDHMPDYRLCFDSDVVVITPKRKKSTRGGLPISSTDAQLRPEIYEKAKALAPGWDVYHIEREWREWLTEPPRNAEAAFLGFCRKWHEKRGAARG
jgi:plasmid replication initiation protein